MTHPLEKDENLALVQWYIEQNQLDKALINIKSLVSANPTNEVLLTGARLYAQLRLFERAQKLFNQYLEVEPEALPVRFQLGMTQFETGNNEAALTTWQSILSAQPHNPPALFYSALALLQLGQAESALSHLQTIMQHIDIDNLYYGKAKDLLSQLDKDPNFRETKKSMEAFSTGNKDIYSTEH